MFAFIDYGVIWNHDTGVDYTKEELGSAGAGVRAVFGNTSMPGDCRCAFEDSEVLTDSGARSLLQLICGYWITQRAGLQSRKMKRLVERF